MNIKEHIKNNPYRILDITTDIHSLRVEYQYSSLKGEYTWEEETRSAYSLESVFRDPPLRTSDSLDDAIIALRSPIGRLQNGLFWFMIGNIYDRIALHCLSKNGDLKQARSTFEKRTGISSLQNQVVCSLLMGPRSYSHALTQAYYLYKYCCKWLVNAIAGYEYTYRPEIVLAYFMKEIAKTVDIDDIAQWDRAVALCHNDDISKAWARAKAENENISEWASRAHAGILAIMEGLQACKIAIPKR